MKKTITLFLITICSLSFGQNKYITKDSVHILWQPDIKITYNDYRGDTTAQLMNLMRKYHFSASACIGIWSVLDIPKKKRNRGKQLEKVYFAPAFERTTSFVLTNDTLQIAIQNLYFDMSEVWARWARKELQRLQDTMKAYGTLTIMFETVKHDMQKKKIEMFQAYFKEVIVDKREGAFEKWQKIIANLLNLSKEFATKPEECHRLLLKKPIEKDYIMAPKVVGKLFGD